MLLLLPDAMEIVVLCILYISLACWEVGHKILIKKQSYQIEQNWKNWQNKQN
jgi:hypothetical protein